MARQFTPALLSFLIFSLGPVWALSPARELEKLELELKLSGIKYLRAQKKELTLIEELDTTKKKLESLCSEISDRDLKIETLNLNITQLKGNLDGIDQKMANSQRGLQKNLVRYYKGKLEPLVMRVVGSSNVPLFIYRYNLIKVLIQKDKQKLKDFQRLKTVQGEEITRLEKEKVSLSALESDKEAKTKEFEKKLAELRKSLEGIQLEKSVMSHRVQKLLEDSDQFKKGPPTQSIEKVVSSAPPSGDSPPTKLPSTIDMSQELNPITDKTEVSSLENLVSRGETPLPSLGVGDLETQAAPFSGFSKLVQENKTPNSPPAEVPPPIQDLLLKHGEKTRSLTSVEAEKMLNYKKELKKHPPSPIPMKKTPIKQLETVKALVDFTLKSPVTSPETVEEFGEGSSSMVFRKGMNFIFRHQAEVIAAAPGKVLYRGVMGPLGKVVIVNHDKGYSTLYAHLDSFAVRVGQDLKIGESIGNSAPSGRGEYRVHFEVRHYGNAVNPRPFLENAG